MSFLARCAAARPQAYPPPFLAPALQPRQLSRNASHATESRANQRKNGPGARLGAKRAATELVVPGNIIFRQRGTHWWPGENCGMGRDHTIFAKEKGYVLYYREKWRNSTGERKFIGVVFRRDQTLPRPPGAKRMRRLGMVERERDMSKPSGVVEEETSTVAGLRGRVDELSAVGKERTTRQRSKEPLLKVPPSQMKIKPGYQYRESNTSIGRVAERMGIKPMRFSKRNRTLAWRRKTAARAKARETKALSSKKNTGTKTKKGG